MRVGALTSRRSAARWLSASAGPSTVATPSSLSDRFGRQHTYLRMSLTERCNLRCTYCMPAEGVELSPDESMLTLAELERLARVFVERGGVEKIRFTGGEPLVRRGVEELCASVAALDGLKQLAITTNAINLERKLEPLVAAGVTHMNISLDTLVPAKFQLVTRRNGCERVLRAIHAAVAAGVPSVKVNCVIMRGFNDDELFDFLALVEEVPIEVRFIEYMPFGKNRWERKKMVSYIELLDRIRERFPATRRLVDGPHETSKTYSPGPSFRGRVGFITSMSEHFCGGCNRMRITADGHLKVCLFGSDETNLRDPMRRCVVLPRPTGRAPPVFTRPARAHAPRSRITAHRIAPHTVLPAFPPAAALRRAQRCDRRRAP